LNFDYNPQNRIIVIYKKRATKAKDEEKIYIYIKN